MMTVHTLPVAIETMSDNSGNVAHHYFQLKCINNEEYSYDQE